MNKESNKYIPKKLLGEGSFGKAYLVECSSDGVNYYLII